MLTKLLKWLIGPENFWPGQRVMLLSGYPVDIASKAHQTFVYGTVHPAIKSGPYSTDVRVLWDGFEGLRHHSPNDLSSRILALVAEPEYGVVNCYCSARAENECTCPSERIN